MSKKKVRPERYCETESSAFKIVKPRTADEDKAKEVLDRLDQGIQRLNQLIDQRASDEPT